MSLSWTDFHTKSYLLLYRPFSLVSKLVSSAISFNDQFLDFPFQSLNYLIFLLKDRDQIFYFGCLLVFYYLSLDIFFANPTGTVLLIGQCFGSDPDKFVGKSASTTF